MPATGRLRDSMRWFHRTRRAHFCSMKIIQEVREYAAKQGISEIAALKQGMEVKAVEFIKNGAEIYRKQ